MQPGHGALTNVVCRDFSPRVRFQICSCLWRNGLSFAGSTGQSILSRPLPTDEIFMRERHDREFP